MKQGDYGRTEVFWPTWAGETQAITISSSEPLSAPISESQTTTTSSPTSTPIPHPTAFISSILSPEEGEVQSATLSIEGELEFLAIKVHPNPAGGIKGVVVWFSPSEDQQSSEVILAIDGLRGWGDSLPWEGASRIAYEMWEDAAEFLRFKVSLKDFLDKPGVYTLDVVREAGGSLGMVVITRRE